MTVSSPAKINLFLAVTGRRADGFHDLVSLVAPVAFGDELEVAVEPGGGDIVLTCDDERVPCGAQNLAVRAAEEFRMAAEVEVGVRIRMNKRIPMGAGLGGASSNAAAVLRALNTLLGSPLAEGDLRLLAASLGSDCPLFLFGEPCVMRGRGERLERLPEAVAARLAGRRLLLYKPDFSISTPWAYGALAAMAPSGYIESRLAEAMLSRWLSSSDGPETLLFNSFAAVADRKFMALPVLAERLRGMPGVQGVLMTGSGSASFALLDEEADAQSLEAEIRDCLGESAFVAETRIL